MPELDVMAGEGLVETDRADGGVAVGGGKGGGGDYRGDVQDAQVVLGVEGWGLVEVAEGHCRAEERSGGADLEGLAGGMGTSAWSSTQGSGAAGFVGVRLEEAVASGVVGFQGFDLGAPVGRELGEEVVGQGLAVVSRARRG